MGLYVREIEKRLQQYWVDHQTYKYGRVQSPIITCSTCSLYLRERLHVGHPSGISLRISFRVTNDYRDLLTHPWDLMIRTSSNHTPYKTARSRHTTRTTSTATGSNSIRSIFYDWSVRYVPVTLIFISGQRGVHRSVLSYYCNQAQQARPITELAEVFSQQGTAGLDVASPSR